MLMGLFGLPLLLIAGLVLFALAGKSEDDPKRERPAALYLSFMTLSGVLLLLAGASLAFNGAVELTDTTPTGWTFSSEGVEVGPEGEIRVPSFDDLKALQSGGVVNHDDDVSQLIGGVIIAAVAVALLRFHLPKLQDLAANSNGPGARIHSRLLYVVCGLTLLVGLGAAGTGLYSVYGMIAPDTAGAGRVPDALRTFVTALAVAAIAAALFREAWSKSDLAPVPADEPEPAPAKKAARTRKAAPPKE